MAQRKKSVDFEARIEQLETLVKKMEKGSMSLGDSLKAFEDGIRIVRECQKALVEAELKVQVLTKDSNGQEEIRDFSEKEA